MKYRPEHKSQVHQKLLTSTSELIRTDGLNQVSVKKVMQSQGMTVGGFYAHFSSKEDLLLKAVAKAFEDSWMQFYEPMEELDDTQWFRHMTACYLNPKHITEKDNMCPIAGLMSEVAKSNELIKKTFQENLKVTLSKIEKRTGKVKASGVMALFAGTLQIASACEDPGFQKELFSNTVKCAVALMGTEVA